MAAPVAPRLTVDLVIRTPGGIVLIERRNPPHGWALPGGFVDAGETVEHAAAREALEETSLRVRNLRLLGVYSDPKRDPRGHTVTIAFSAEADGVPEGRDDARRAAVFDPTRLPGRVVFDHRRIIADWRARRKRTGGPAGTRRPLRSRTGARAGRG